jgi:hypothetical protein
VGNIILEKSSKMKASLKNILFFSFAYEITNLRLKLKIQEYLKLLGIRWYVILFTWWLRSLVVFLLLSLVVASFVKIVIQTNQSNTFLFADKAILKNTDFFLFLAFLLAYSLQCSTFILFFSQLFSTSNTFFN